MRSALAVVIVLGSLTSIPVRVVAQDQYVGMQPDRPPKEPRLTAVLIDADKKALKHAATVSVVVEGLKLVDPDTEKGTAHDGQGHLHYRLDGGPVIATTATKLSFHELASGKHSLTVLLAANDHSPLGPSVKLSIKIP
jgi:hypothetical protein